jgi:hypothetical protein
MPEQLNRSQTQTVVMIENWLLRLATAVLVLLLKHTRAELYAYCIGLLQMEDSKPILILQGRLGE